MNKKLINFTAIVAVLALASCKQESNKTGAGIDIANIDSTVKPTEDFYQFVNGNWLKNNPVPASESRWGSFNELYEKNTVKLKAILEESAADKNAPAGSNKQKIGTYYSLAMDSVKLQKEGAAPLKEEFDRIEAIKTKDDVLKEIAHLHSIGISALFIGYVGQDPKISTLQIPQLYQGGIGLPDRDYYTNTDERTLGIQKAYKEHMENMFKLLGDKEDMAKKNVDAVYAIETNLAKASMTNIELRDPEKQYNKKSYKELAELTPNINWITYLTGVGVTELTDVIVCQPEFFKEVYHSF
ncbi:MAG: M13 family metallopeptidase N-terminal domain-containing protein, partial [Bacteroidia bacterium]